MSIEANKALARRYFEEFVNQRQLSVLHEIVAPDGADETVVGVGGSGTRADFEGHAKWLWENVPDAEITVDELVAERDKVVVFWSLKGTHTGHIFGVPATGRPFLSRSISWLTIDDGQVVRYNVLPDRLSVIQQLTAG